MEKTFVDRIDERYVSDCPHLMKVRAIERLGVKIFVHEDGTPCTLLNSLQLDSATLNLEDASLAAKKRSMTSIFDQIDDPEVYSRLSTDPELLKNLAEELESEQDVEKLEQFFLKLCRSKNCTQVIDALSKYCKREELLNNITYTYTTYGEEIEADHLFPLVKEFLEKYRKKNSTS